MKTKLLLRAPLILVFFLALSAFSTPQAPATQVHPAAVKANSPMSPAIYPKVIPFTLVTGQVISVPISMPQIVVVALSISVTGKASFLLKLPPSADSTYLLVRSRGVRSVRCQFLEGISSENCRPEEKGPSEKSPHMHQLGLPTFSPPDFSAK